MVVIDDDGVCCAGAGPGAFELRSHIGEGPKFSMASRPVLPDRDDAPGEAVAVAAVSGVVTRQHFARRALAVG